MSGVPGISGRRHKSWLFEGKYRHEGLGIFFFFSFELRYLALSSEGNWVSCRGWVSSSLCSDSPSARTFVWISGSTEEHR